MSRGLVVLVAFLALQATSNAALSLSPQGLYQQLVDQANSLREKISSTIGNIEDHVVNNTDAIVTKIHDDIQSVAKNVRTQVEAVVAKFEAAGKTAVECTEKIPSTINELVTNVTESAASCVTTEVKDGESLVTDLLGAGKEINATLGGVQDKLAKCNSNFLTVATCSIGVITEAAATVSTQSVKIASDITKAAALVAGFQMNVNSCETKVFQSIPARVQSATGTVTNCYTSS